MKAKEFDADLDAGEDVTAALDLSNVRRLLQKLCRVNMDYPE